MPAAARLLARAAAETGSWLLPLLLCVLRLGLRIGKVLALQPDDLDLTTPGRETLSVTRARNVDRHGAVVIKEPKTEAAVRTLRLSAPIVAELRRWLEVGRLEWKLKAGWRTRSMPGMWRPASGLRTGSRRGGRRMAGGTPSPRT